MRSKLLSMLTVIGAVTVLVLAANTVALATTGKAILAGKINTSSKLTSIVRTTPGTALQVKTKSTANAPFAVNGKGKVVNLNVDKVDGLDGGTRALSWTYTGVSAQYRMFNLSGLPAGTYLLAYEVYMNSATAPAGTEASCYFVKTGTSTYGGETSSVLNNYYNALSGTALMSAASTGGISLGCRTSADGNWTASPSQPVRITAIPIAGVTTMGAPPASRLAAK